MRVDGCVLSPADLWPHLDVPSTSAPLRPSRSQWSWGAGQPLPEAIRDTTSTCSLGVMATTLHPSGPRRQGLGICCGHTPGQVPSLSPLPLPTVPGFPRHGVPTHLLSFPLDKEQTAAGHSGRTSFLENSQNRRRRRRRGEEGEVGRCCPGSLHTQGGSWTKTSFPGKAGHVLIPAARSQSPWPPQHSLPTPCSQTRPSLCPVGTPRH